MFVEITNILKKCKIQLFSYLNDYVKFSYDNNKDALNITYKTQYQGGTFMDNTLQGHLTNIHMWDNNDKTNKQRCRQFVLEFYGVNGNGPLIGPFNAVILKDHTKTCTSLFINHGDENQSKLVSSIVQATYNLMPENLKKSKKDVTPGTATFLFGS